jgi:hypothetical protein
MKDILLNVNSLAGHNTQRVSSPSAKASLTSLNGQYTEKDTHPVLCLQDTKRGHGILP